MAQSLNVLIEIWYAHIFIAVTVCGRMNTTSGTLMQIRSHGAMQVH